MMKRFFFQTLLDRLGVVLSASCAVHCMLTPLLVTVFSTGLLSWLVDEQVEFSLMLTAMIIGLIGIGSGCVRHKRYALFAFPALALTLFASSRFLEEESPIEVVLVVGGSLVLAVGHLFNLNACRHCHPSVAVAGATEHSTSNESQGIPDMIKTNG